MMADKAFWDTNGEFLRFQPCKFGRLFNTRTASVLFIHGSQQFIGGAHLGSIHGRSLCMPAQFACLHHFAKSQVWFSSFGTHLTALQPNMESTCLNVHIQTCFVVFECKCFALETTTAKDIVTLLLPTLNEPFKATNKNMPLKAQTNHGLLRHTKWAF